MSIEGEIASFVLPTWARIAIKLAPFVAIAILLAALLQTRATLHDARTDAKIQAANDAAEAAKQQAKWANDGKAAAETYATAMTNRQPIILHATDTVREYAQTPAGAAVCAAPDIVSRTDALDRSLWPAAPAARGH
jgi:hypothetical protein